MISEPFLSVIIPVYNAEQYLQECLDSILNQTLSDYEVILVDDGSTDSSPAICDRYAALHDNVLVLHQTNQGQSSAREAGFSISRGTYIAFADSDDRVDSHMYGDLCRLARTHHADIIHCDFTAVMPDREKVCAVPYKPGLYHKQMLQEQVYPNMIYSGTFFSFHVAPNIWNKLFRRELLARHLFQVPHDIRNGEDFPVTFACMLDAESVYFTDKPYYYYISRPDSMCRKITSKELRSLYRLFDVLDDMLTPSAFPCLKPQLAYFTVYQMLLYAIPVMQEMSASGADEKELLALFREISSDRHIAEAVRLVRIRDINGIRNRLFVCGIRLHLYPLIRIAVTPG